MPYWAELYTKEWTKMSSPIT